jgi:hypothetical protein
MNEYYPNLMDRIIRREPNAYLASLYWDSELFRRSKTKRVAKTKTEEIDDTVDYRIKVFEFVNNPENMNSSVRIKNVSQVRQTILKFQQDIGQPEWKRLYELLVAGDPKDRTLRAVSMTLHGNDWKRNTANENS